MYADNVWKAAEFGSSDQLRDTGDPLRRGGLLEMVFGFVSAVGLNLVSGGGWKPDGVLQNRVCERADTWRYHFVHWMVHTGWGAGYPVRTDKVMVCYLGRFPLTRDCPRLAYCRPGSRGDAENAERAAAR